MTKIAVIVQGGLGDNILYAARLRSLLAKHQAHQADFYLIRQNMWHGVVDMIVEFLEAQDSVDKVMYYSGSPSGYKAVVDWTKDDAPRDCAIETNYKAQYLTTNVNYVADLLEGIDNPITVHPYSLNSVADPMGQKYLRSPKEDWWRDLFKAIREAGGTPIVLGGPDERIDWQTDDVVDGYLDDKDEFMNNIPLLYNVKGHIGIASWTWQLVHYYGQVNTYVLWFKDHHWVGRTVSEDTSKLTITHSVPCIEDIISNIKVLNGT